MPDAAVQPGLTVVVSSFRQPRCLLQQIALLQRCPTVRSIRVNWFAGNGAIPSVRPRGASRLPPVTFDVLPDALTMRFQPRDFRTTAIFSMDVDMFYSCRALTAAYRLWRRWPRAVVGFRPRMLEPGQPISPRGSFASPHSSRNLLLATKGAVHHRDTFSAFFARRYAALRDEVDRAFTAEDLLMGFVQALEFNASVVLVCLGHRDHCTATCTENNVSALDRRSGGGTRHAVLQRLFRTLGNPLVRLQGNATIHYPLTVSKGEHARCGEEKWQSCPPKDRQEEDQQVQAPPIRYVHARTGKLEEAKGY